MIKVTLELANGYYYIYKIFLVIGFTNRKSTRLDYNFLPGLL